MAVSKELLARYKEMKAKGINITLSELKAQMEEEANPAKEEIATVQAPDTSYQQEQTDTNTWTTTYSTNNYTEEQSTPTIQTPYQEQVSPIVQPTQNFSFSKPEPLEQPSQQTNSYSEQFVEQKPSFIETPKLQDDNTESFQPDAITAPTRKYALIGYPLGHSLSAYIHDAGFKSLGLKASYEILETPPDTLVDRIKYFKTHDYSGFNVTIPLKLPITLFLDEIDPSANIANAVNTVVIDPETKFLKGYNTDALGFRNAIPDDITLCGKVAGILGTGGAARAAITALAQSQMKEIKLFTRNVPNSLELVNYLRKTFQNVEFNTYQIERIRDLSDIDLLVNTTPIGMLGRAADFTPVEENELRTLKQGAVVYDVIYNPKKTILLKLAQKYGYRTINGVDMFIHQALAAEKIWTGRTPDFKDMKIAALENL